MIYLHAGLIDPVLVMVVMLMLMLMLMLIRLIDSRLVTARWFNNILLMVTVLLTMIRVSQRLLECPKTKTDQAQGKNLAQRLPL